MANSPARYAKRQRSSDSSNGNSSERDSKRQWFPSTPHDDDSRLDDQDAAFIEAITYFEDSTTASTDIDISKIYSAEKKDEAMSVSGPEPFGEADAVQHEAGHSQIEGKAAKNTVDDLKESSFGVVCFGTVGSI